MLASSPGSTQAPYRYNLVCVCPLFQVPSSDFPTKDLYRGSLQAKSSLLQQGDSRSEGSGEIDYSANITLIIFWQVGTSAIPCPFL